MSIHQKTIFRLTRLCLVMVSASLIFLLRPQQTFGQVVEADQAQNVTDGNYRTVAYVAGTDQPVDVSISGDQALTYRLGNGNDESLFDVSASTGLVRFKSAPDFDKPADSDGDNVYVVDVIAEEKGKKTKVTTHITVAAPTFTSTAVTTVNDNEFYTYDISVTDTDNDAVTITGSTLPSWLTVLPRVDETSDVSTFVGTGSNFGFLDATGALAEFNRPSGMAVDANGNIFLADANNRRIRKITPQGVVTTFAGSGGSGVADGTGTEATFGTPVDLAFDSSGNLFVVEQGSHGVRKITPAGVVTKFAGRFSTSFSSNEGFTDGQGTDTRFDSPAGIAIDDNDFIYISDQGNHAIRRISPTGAVITLAGSGGSGSVDGLGAAARFRSPRGLTVGQDGNIYVGDNSGRVRKVTPQGLVTTVISSGLSIVSDIDADKAGNLIILDLNLRKIYKRNAQGVLSFLAGSGNTIADGTGSDASFSSPRGIAIDANGNIFISDYVDHTIRKITPNQKQLFGDPANQIGIHNVVLTADDGNSAVTNQTFTVTVGNGTAPVFTSATIAGFREEGAGTAYTAKVTDVSPVTFSLGITQDEALFSIGSTTGEVTFDTPPDFETPADGDTDNTYVLEVIASDASLSTSLMVNIIVTDLSDVSPVFTSTPITTFDDNAAVLFNYGITTTHADKNGVAITGTTIPSWLALSQTAQVTTLAGSESGFVDGTGTAAKFTFPKGMTVDAAGNVFVADVSNNRIRKITPEGVVTTFVGAGAGSTNGTGTSATFYNPRDIAIDASGNFYVANTYYNTIRKITPAGVTTTYAGIPKFFNGGYVDGPAASAQFQTPGYLTVDDAGFVYVAEESKVRVISPDGIVSTLAGSTREGLVDGTGIGALFENITGIAVDIERNVYVGSQVNSSYRIRKITPEGVVTQVLDANNSPLTFSGAIALEIDVAGNLLVAEGGNRIKQVTPQGEVTVIAGSSSSGTDDGEGTDARFSTPVGLAIGLNGDIFVSESGNRRVRKIERAYQLTGDPFGQAGMHPVVLTADDGDGNTAVQSFTIDVLDKQADPIITSTPLTAIDDDQTYVYDLIATDQDREDVTFAGTTVPAWLSVVEVTPGNFRLTGDPLGQGGVHSIVLTADDGNGGTVQQTFDITVTDVTLPVFTSSSSVSFLENSTATAYTAVATDGQPVTYSLGVANDEGLFSIVSATGLVTFDASPDFEAPGDADTDNAYIVEVIANDGTNDNPLIVTIRVQNVSDIASTFTSTPVTSVDSDQPYQYDIEVSDVEIGAVNVVGTTLPAWVTLSKSLEVSTLAGSSSGFVNDTGTSARFSTPRGMVVDGSGNIYVVDAGNYRIRKITPAGVVSTFVGSGNRTFGDGTGVGAHFFQPSGITIDGSGNLYVTDYHSIRKITPAGVVSTFAGSTSGGSADATGTSATFNIPEGITYSHDGNLYVADTRNDKIRKITLQGVVTTIAGSFGSFADGTGAAARFNDPAGIVADDQGNLIVSDRNNDRIRKVTPAGVVTTIAGSSAGFVDDTGTAARFNDPTGIAIDLEGNYLVTDYSNARIRKVTPAGVVTTLAGTGQSGSIDGEASQAQIYRPNGIATLGTDVFVADGRHRIRRIVEKNRLTGDATGQEGTHNVVLTADDDSDDNGQTLATQSFTITVNDVTPPVFTSDTSVDFDENATGTVYTAVATDFSTVGFSLGTSNDEGLFTLTGSVLTFMSSPDFETPVDTNTDNVYKVELIGADLSGNMQSLLLDVNVINVSDANPVFTSTAITSINESTLYSYTVTGSDTDIEVVSFTDTTVPAWLTLNVTGTGASAVYTLSGDPAGQSGSFNVVIDASDGNGGTATQSFTVAVVDDVKPAITSAASLIVQENVTGTIYTATATDTNPITYSLSSANDGTRFNIDGTSGVLNFITSPDFEAPADLGANNIYDVEVRITDVIGNQSIIPLQVIISNVSDIDPVFDSSPILTAANNATYNYEVEASDQDNDFVTVSATTAPVWLSVNTALTVETLAGSGASGLRKFSNQQSVGSIESRPDRMVVGPEGNTFIIESKNGDLRKISKTGVVSIFDNSFNDPTAIAVDAVGSVYVADIGDGAIYRVTRDGIKTKLLDVQTSPIAGLAIDASGTFYFSYTDLHTIWKVTPAGVASLFAGQANVPGTNNGAALSARFNHPHGLAIDVSNNLYVADFGNSTIRKITSTGVVSTLAGFNFGSADGIGASAEFAGPTSVSVDNNGDILVADAKNNRIRKISPTGATVTFMGSTAGFKNGPVVDATFNYPTGVVEAPNGDLVILDQDNNSVRRVFLSQVLSGDATGRAGIYNILLGADDGQGGTADQNFTLTVADVTSPEFTSDANVSFAENGTGTAYTVAATDEGTVTYTLGTTRDESLFTMAGSLITFVSAPDFETPGDGDTNNAYEIEVIADDGTNQSSLVVTVSVTNVDDTDPVFTSAASVSFEENGTGIAHTVVATDANQLSFRLGNSNDEGQFGLINSTGGTAALLFNSPPDFEDPKDGDTNNTYLVEVIATDGINEASQLVTITVTDVNEASFSPIMITLILNYAENGTGGVYNASAASSSLIFYSLGSANDESLFNLVGGSLKFNNSPDFETPLDADVDNEYKVQMTITDGISSVNIMLVITVTDELDAISAPIITGITDDTGSSNSDGITNDSNIIISGTAEPLSSVEVFTQYGPVRTTQADANGDWALDITNISLMEMSFNLTAVATNLASDSSPASNVFVLIADYTAPAKPVITSITDDTGSSNSDGVTNDANIMISGRAEALSSVEVFTQFGPVRTTQTDANGDWVLDITDISLMEMNFNLTAEATDLAGNSSATSDIFALTADYTAPAKPVITSITDDTGSSNSDGITNDANIIISGTAEALSSVEVFTQFGPVRTTQTDANGDWSLDITDITLAEMSFDLTAKATDLAGNASATSDIFVLTADYTAPVKPVITAMTDDTGSSNSDGITNDSNIIISGTAEALSSVEVSSSQYGSIRTTQTDANGDWSLDITDITLAERSFNLTAEATDLAGNLSATSDVFVLTADYTDPTVVLTAPSAPSVSASGYVVTAQFSEDVTDFTLSDITVATGTASNLQTVNANTFTFTVTSGNAAADVSIAASLVSDLAGNPSTVSNILNLDFTIPPLTAFLQNSLVDFVKSEEISLYPNPVSSVLTIDLSELSAKEVDILLINTSGIAVFGKSHFTGKSLRLDVSGYTNGLYIVQLNDGSRIIRKKVLVRK